MTAIKLLYVEKDASDIYAIKGDSISRSIVSGP